MRSKTSFCNGALLRKNLTRFWPLWAVYAAAWLLAGPVTCFTSAFGRYYQSMEPALRYHRIVRDYLSTWCEFSQVGAVLAGVLFAMALFSYVTMPRAVGLFHSFPIRREKRKAVLDQLFHGGPGGGGGPGGLRPSGISGADRRGGL